MAFLRLYVTASCGFMGSFRLKCTDGNPSLDLSHTNPFNLFYPNSWLEMEERRFKDTVGIVGARELNRKL
jgi:hypothetical protein